MNDPYLQARLQRRASERARDEWAEYHGLRESRAYTDPVPWLLGKRPPSYGVVPRWYDHGTRWTRDGKPFCLVGQPYDLSSDDMRDLVRLEEEFGLTVVVSSHPDWHYPGHILGVTVERRS